MTVAPRRQDLGARRAAPRHQRGVGRVAHVVDDELVGPLGVDGGEIERAVAVGVEHHRAGHQRHGARARRVAGGEHAAILQPPRQRGARRCGAIEAPAEELLAGLGEEQRLAGRGLERHHVLLAWDGREHDAGRRIEDRGDRLAAAEDAGGEHLERAVAIEIRDAAEAHRHVGVLIADVGRPHDLEARRPARVPQHEHTVPGAGRAHRRAEPAHQLGPAAGDHVARLAEREGHVVAEVGRLRDQRAGGAVEEAHVGQRRLHELGRAVAGDVGEQHLPRAGARRRRQRPHPPRRGPAVGEAPHHARRVRAELAAVALLHRELGAGATIDVRDPDIRERAHLADRLAPQERAGVGREHERAAARAPDQLRGAVAVEIGLADQRGQLEVVAAPARRALRRARVQSAAADVRDVAATDRLHQGRAERAAEVLPPVRRRRLQVAGAGRGAGAPGVVASDRPVRVRGVGRGEDHRGEDRREREEAPRGGRIGWQAGHGVLHT